MASPLGDMVAEVMVSGCALATVFHSPLEASLAALAVLSSAWDGPVGVYPEAERRDYIAAAKHADDDIHGHTRDLCGLRPRLRGGRRPGDRRLLRYRA